MINENCTCPGFPQVPSPPQYVCVEVYTVEAGDTLYSISQMYNVSVPILMQVNKVLNPYNLLIGQKICIPGKPSENNPIPPNPNPAPPMPPVAPAPPVVPPTGPPQQMPECNGTYHTVVAGDTLYMIAKMHKVTLDAIMNANPHLDPYNLRVGMKICVPTGGGNNGGNNGRCPNGMIYNTQRGDTLARILDRFGVTYEALKKANPGVDFCESLETMSLCIPM